MTWTQEQRRTAAVAAALGYKNQNIKESSVPVSEFEVGDGVIVLTDRGEPIMSGQIEEIDVAEVMDGGVTRASGIKVGRDWYYDTTSYFRRM
jgi:hypothetical protein